MATRTPFAEQLRQHRKALDLTQRALAARAGYALSTIHKLETGELRPSRQLASDLAQVLELHPDTSATFVTLARAVAATIPLHGTAPVQPSARMHGLPTPLTSLVGRAHEIADVVALLQQPGVRLVTLHGPGGIGKTRLALAAARVLGPAFTDGIYFVDLTAVRDPGLVAAAVATACGVQVRPGQPIDDGLHTYLVDKHCLLVLDNFEQVAAAAPLIAALLQAAPELGVLVTSRAILRLSGEHTFQVPPLALPDDGPDLSDADVAGSAAVRLFLERARALQVDAARSSAELRVVNEICRRLDGLPLAIELAAARSKLLPPEAVLARLNRRLAVLTGGARDLPARQQTLHETIDWSYGLLSPAEQTLLARLAVFVGGCRVEAAEAVCNGAGDLRLEVFAGLASLIDQSLLRQKPDPDGEPRFVMLETIQEYAAARLVASQDLEAARDLHLRYFVQFAQQAEREYWGAAAEGWLTQMDHEHRNLTAALTWARERNPEEGLRLVSAMWWFWNVYGYLTEGRQWAESLLAASSGTPSPQRAGALAVIAHFAWWQGDLARTRAASTECIQVAGIVEQPVAEGFARIFLGYIEPDVERRAAVWQEAGALFRAAGFRWGSAYSLMLAGYIASARQALGQAEDYFRHGLTAYQALGNTWGIGWMLHNLGDVASCRGKYRQAIAYFSQAVAERRDQRYKAGLADSLMGLGRAALMVGQLDEAEAAYEESVALLREVGAKPSIAPGLAGLGFVAWRRGDGRRAERRFGEALAAYQAHGGQEPAAVWSLIGMAEVTAADGHPVRGVRVLAATGRRIEEVGSLLEQGETATYRDALAAVQRHVDEAAWATAWAQGQAMTLDEAITYALEVVE